VAGACECGNEPSGSMICGHFPDQLRACSQERLFAVELVGWFVGWLVRI